MVELKSNYVPIIQKRKLDTWRDTRDLHAQRETRWIDMKNVILAGQGYRNLEFELVDYTVKKNLCSSVCEILS